MPRDKRSASVAAKPLRQPLRVGMRRVVNLVASLFKSKSRHEAENHAGEIAVREELDAVGHYIEEAQGYLAQIRVLHEEALNEFSRAQGE